MREKLFPAQLRQLGKIEAKIAEKPEAKIAEKKEGAVVPEKSQCGFGGPIVIFLHTILTEESLRWARRRWRMCRGKSGSTQMSSRCIS
jgi:hypothetical protein